MHDKLLSIRREYTPRISKAHNYIVKECVGRGNFGDVYRAIDRTTNKVVAIKVVDLENTNERLEVLAQEIFFLAELKSPYIINYITTLLEDASMWIVMEYCGGGSCSDLLKYYFNNGLPEKKVAYITREILKGLQYLHEQKKIHRDIKAANILLTEEGHVKLGDFGVSGQLKSTLRRGTIVGTPYWMAPEVASQNIEGYDEKIDIWSLGITVFELLKGVPPLVKLDPIRVLANLSRKSAPRLQGAYSDAAKSFVALCLIKNPNERPAAVDLLKFPFVRFITVTNLKHEIELVKEYKRYPKSPGHMMQDRLYNALSRTNIEWDFASIRANGPKKYELTPVTKESPTSSSIMNENGTYLNQSQLITPITNPSTPSFRKRRLESFELRAEKELKQDFEASIVKQISSDVNSTVPQCRRLSNSTQSQLLTPTTKSTASSFRKYQPESYEIETGQTNGSLIMNQMGPGIDLKTIQFDYLNNVICHSLRRMDERANAEEAKVYIGEMLNLFKDVESNVAGFSEVFIEEISVRLESIRNYLSK
ncbi:hypothetical protein NCAS_0A00280 [Naumovozyma castellii]|uniref:non-specific serine/threonine protein kinase n=1 Tax=Naumovozyma castellii TaxID=27288 RepID=G0V552_NAUCA|nr:hypothetical protein NCAS_0A00280 [Naumovozyma castellii CBS 4309]CCC66588.1 hypothetical protein NCAS_0A00280 [Naumovozyma castellii CBS 4309]